MCCVYLYLNGEIFQEGLMSISDASDADEMLTSAGVDFWRVCDGLGLGGYVESVVFIFCSSVVCQSAIPSRILDRCSGWSWMCDPSLFHHCHGPIHGGPFLVSSDAHWVGRWFQCRRSALGYLALIIVTAASRGQRRLCCMARCPVCHLSICAQCHLKMDSSIGFVCC